MISIVVLSKDRPAQLRLLLDSLDRNGSGIFIRPPIVIARGASVDRDAARGAWLIPEHDFEQDVRAALEHTGAYTCFMCDDGILYRRPAAPLRYLRRNPRILCHSLRLGANTTVQYPSATRQGYRGNVWSWELGAGDFGYPGSVDAHVFRTDVLLEILDGKRFPNPTALEVAMVVGCAEISDAFPSMSCDDRSSYVGVPVNRTSEQSNVRYGDVFPSSVEQCLERWERGDRIDLDKLDFTSVDGAHTEIRLRWTADDRRPALHV